MEFWKRIEIDEYKKNETPQIPKILKFLKEGFFLRLKDFWGDAAIGFLKKLSARKCPKIGFLSVFLIPI